MKKIFTLFALLCLLCISGQANAACYIIGEANGNSWNPQVGVELKETETGSNIYTGEVTLSSDKYIGVADMLLTNDDWDYFNANCRWYPKDGVRTLTAGTKSYMQKSDPGYDNNSWGPTPAGIYNITVNFNDNSILLELLKEDNGLYLRGNEISGWNTGTLLAETETPNVFKAENVTLSGFFKIGSADWSRSYGPADNNTLVTIGTPITLSNSGGSKNLYLDGTYNATVTLDLTGENPVITITGDKTASGVYLKGDVNGWSDNADWQFTSLGAGVYELEKTMLASDGKFKITANGAWYGAESTSFGGPFEVSTSGNDMALPENSIVSKFTFTIAEDGKSTLSITEGVLDNNLYLRGNVTNWKVNDAYKFTETETAGIYTLENVKLQGYFKIADSLWKNYNIGGKDDGFVEVGEDVIVANSNTSVNFYLDGTYQCSLITLDLTGEEPVLTIEGETTNSGIFLYGAFNEWGAADDMADWEFIDNGEGIYTLEKEVLASDGAFCININGENAGTSTAQVIIYGDTYTLDGKQNMTLPVSTRTESFELLISDENAAYLTVNMGEEPSEPEQDPSAVEQINASSNASAEYFNLQGVKVSTDKLSNGIYIKKQGSKTTKVIL